MSPDIYWVTYDGKIPKHAVRGGTEKDGTPVYVARASLHNNVFPGKLTTLQEGWIAHNGKDYRADNFEVLCQKGGTVSWHPSKDGSIPEDATPCGKTSNDEVLYCGRVAYEGTVTPGNVHPSYKKLFIPFYGREVAFDEYEVLVIN